MIKKNKLLFSLLALLLFSNYTYAVVIDCPAADKLNIEVPEWTSAKVTNNLNFEGLKLQLKAAYLKHAGEEHKFSCHYNDGPVFYSRDVDVSATCKFVNDKYNNGYCSGGDCSIDCP